MSDVSQDLGHEHVERRETSLIRAALGIDVRFLEKCNYSV